MHSQIASALDFLHRKHVVYLDLKSDNVLVWKFPLPGHQNADQEVLLKITDYGISRMSSTANEIRYTSIAGTPGFIAPEVYTGRRQDLQSDKVFLTHTHTHTHTHTANIIFIFRLIYFLLECFCMSFLHCSNHLSYNQIQLTL